ncbi:MAG: hypothetical protein IJM75_02740 [Ruminococcus sp.]|nr:hypothetical protein [Ruminococcus sp.]
MFTSDTDRRSCINQALGCGCGAAFWALFGGIYEHFSHSVYSYYMIYAFAPLLVMSLLYIYWGAFAKLPPGRAARNLLSASAATASVGMAAKGVVVIFGSTNRLLPIYIIPIALTLIAGIVCYLEEVYKYRQAIKER